MCIPLSWADLGKSARDTFKEGYFQGCLDKKTKSCIDTTFSTSALSNRQWPSSWDWRRGWLPLQFSCLENPMGRDAWEAVVHGVAESDMTDWLSRVPGNLETRHIHSVTCHRTVQNWQNSGSRTELPLRPRSDKVWLWDLMLPSHTAMVKNSNIKSSYKRECIHLNCDVDSDFAGPAIHGSAVFDCDGWLPGFKPMTWDSAKS